MNDKSLILVTHRPGLLQLVDRIMVISHGKILDDAPRDIVVQKYFGSHDRSGFTEVPLKRAKVNLK